MFMRLNNEMLLVLSRAHVLRVLYSRSLIALSSEEEKVVRKAEREIPMKKVFNINDIHLINEVYKREVVDPGYLPDMKAS